MAPIEHRSPSSTQPLLPQHQAIRHDKPLPYISPRQQKELDRILDAVEAHLIREGLIRSGPSAGRQPWRKGKMRKTVRWADGALGAGSRPASRFRRLLNSIRAAVVGGSGADSASLLSNASDGKEPIWKTLSKVILSFLVIFALIFAFAYILAPDQFSL